MTLGEAGNVLLILRHKVLLDRGRHNYVRLQLRMVVTFQVKQYLFGLEAIDYIVCSSSEVFGIYCTLI
jgi:hypothetical protein